MRWAAAIILNVIAIVLAAYWIPGFLLTGGVIEWLKLGVILAVLNFLLKPILRLLLGPVIVLTLGLGLIAVNMFILYLLDISSSNLSIQGVPALFYAALLIGIFNFVFHFVTKK